MALVAQLKPSWDTSSRAQFAAAWQESATSLVVITDIDAGNVDPAKVVVTDPSSSTPNVFVDYRSATGGWRHLMWAVEGADGKRPVFDLNRSSRVSNLTPGAGWGLLWTQDFVTWTKSPQPTIVTGTPSKIRCQFTDPLPSGRVYFSTQPMHQEGHSAILAASLLENYPSICSPTASANAYGVFNVSPVETDDLGRQVGGRNQYAVKLSWPGPTTDGRRKRVMVMMSGIHAAGEGNASVAHRAALEWMLESASAEAVAFRANWDVYTYFNLTPNGYYGGHNRTNFRNGTDPNRAWASTTLAEINAVKTAIPVDLDLGAGGFWDAMYSWHAYHQTPNDFQCWVTPANADAGTRSPVMQAMIDAGSGIFNDPPVFDDSGTLNTDVWWAETQGAVVSFDTELQQNGNMDPQFFKDVASKWMRTLVAVDSDGWFVPAPSITAVTASNITQTGATITVTRSNPAAGTLYLALYPVGITPTWSIGAGWSATPVYTDADTDPGTGSTYQFVPDASGLTAGTQYVPWAVWYDGTTTVGPVAGTGFETAVGTSSISADVVVSYSVRTDFVQSVPIAYTIQNAISSDVHCASLITNLVSQDRLIQYLTNGEVSQQQTATYSVNTGIDSSVTTTYITRWAVLNALSPTYSVLEQTLSENTSSYNVVGVVVSSNEVVYAISGAISAIFSEAVVEYLVSQSIGDDNTSQYFVNLGTSQDIQVTYQTATNIQSDKVVNYEILSASSVASITTTEYAIAESVVTDKTALYSIALQVTSDSITTFNTQTTVLTATSTGYVVRDSVSDSYLSTYSVREHVSSTIALSYTVLSEFQSVYNSTSINYTIDYFVISDLSLLYVVQAQSLSHFTRVVVIKPTEQKFDVLRSSPARYIVRRA